MWEIVVDMMFGGFVYVVSINRLFWWFVLFRFMLFVLVVGDFVVFLELKCGEDENKSYNVGKCEIGKVVFD